jgi:DNA-binding PucR family transcriptional regulator
LVHGTDAQRPLSVIASAATRWVWIPGDVAPDLDRLEEVVDRIAGVRVAVGSTGRGVEGFRRSHLDAITTQRMLARLNSRQRVARFDAVELVCLVSQDPDRAQQFVKQTLGGLATAAPDLRAAVLTFVNAQCNASRAAARLYTHRNTLLRRISRAEQLLPRPLSANSVQVAVALDMVRWSADGDT